MARKKRTEIDAGIKLARTRVLFEKLLQNFAAPEDLNVSQWAERNRVLTASSAEPGPWRTSRTPYLEEPMKAFTDPAIDHIVMVAASQVGKSEFELNCLGYIIDQDPGVVMYVQPTVDEGKKFSRLRIDQMIDNSKVLKQKVKRAKSRDATNTVMQKAFPGGQLIVAGSNAPTALASTPARYIIGDEMDRWAKSAGKEGDPWELARARQITFTYSKKAVEVSTPTVKGDSRIADAFETGTKERWCHRCPDCGEYHNIQWKDIRIEYDTFPNGRSRNYTLTFIAWVCPGCGTVHDEREMRAQPQKWIAENPSAREKGIRSFWLNAFCSPWMSWWTIGQKFLDAKDDQIKLEVVYNTLFGMLWEVRDELPDNDALQSRREQYEAELPDGVLLLTCAVDTQDDRLEYEVLGHGRHGETWGIQKAAIPGRPDISDSDGVWETLDTVIDRTWRFSDGRGLRISTTFVDSGGHYTQDVYHQCAKRFYKRVFPIKGNGHENVPFTQVPKRTKIVINGRQIGEVFLYSLGVNAGKSLVMSNIKVQTPGPKYCHFPSNEDRGYNAVYFDGLMSEHLVYKNGRMVWDKIAGHKRNEPLDLRVYNLAAASIQAPDWDELERGLREQEPGKEAPKLLQGGARRRVIKNKLLED